MLVKPFPSKCRFVISAVMGPPCLHSLFNHEGIKQFPPPASLEAIIWILRRYLQLISFDLTLQIGAGENNTPQGRSSKKEMGSGNGGKSTEEK